MYLKQKDLAKYRELKLREQKNIDPITKRVITDPVLDHDHSTGFVRNVLQREVNSFDTFFQYL